jgi:hypothetical protein
VTTSDPFSPLWTVQLTGTAALVRGVVDPSSIPFGQVEVGSSSDPVPIEVRNEEAIPLVLDVPMMRPGSDPGFVVSFDPETATLAPGASVTVEATFAPVGSGLHVATWELTAVGGDAPFASVALIGEGVPPVEESPEVRGGRCGLLTSGAEGSASAGGALLALLSVMALTIACRRGRWLKRA